MKRLLLSISVLGFFIGAGCESDRHRDHAEHWDRDHHEHAVYRAEPSYAPPPATVYRDHPEYGYRSR